MARPFFPWLGSKKRLLPQLLLHFPKKIRNYYDPFLGSGAVFFAIADRIEGAAYLNDANEHVANAFNQVAWLPGVLSGVLSRDPITRSEYEKLRDVVNNSILYPNLHNASNFLRLIHSSYGSGMWRENTRGEFNVPFKGKMTALPTMEELKDCSVCLLGLTPGENPMGITVASRDFFDCDFFANARRGDVIYADPPYWGTFSSYHKGSWTWAQQSYLEQQLRAAARRGALVIASNSDNEDTRSLYSRDLGWKIHEVELKSFGHAGNAKRKSRKELIMVNGGTR